MNNDYELEDDVFKRMDRNDQLLTIYRTFNATREACSGRFKKLENRKKIDTAIGTTSGLVGGAVTILLMNAKKFLGG